MHPQDVVVGTDRNRNDRGIRRWEPERIGQAPGQGPHPSATPRFVGGRPERRPGRRNDGRGEARRVDERARAGVHELHDGPLCSEEPSVAREGLGQRTDLKRDPIRPESLLGH